MASYNSQLQQIKQSWESLDIALDNPYAYTYDWKEQKFESAGWGAWGASFIPTSLTSSMDHLVNAIQKIVDRTFDITLDKGYTNEQLRHLPPVVYRVYNKIPSNQSNLKQRMAMLYEVLSPEAEQNTIEEDFILLRPRSSSPGAENSRSSPTKILEEFSFKDHQLKKVKYERSLEKCLNYLQEYVGEGEINFKIKIVDVDTGLKKMYAVLKESTHVRKRYRNFLDALRECLCTEDYRRKLYVISQQYYPNEIEILHKILEARFAGNNMDDHCQEIVEASMQFVGNPYSLSWDEQFSLIEQMPDELQENIAASTLATICSYTNILFDPHRHTNVPYINYRFDLNGMTRINIRLGTPTCEDALCPASVIQEFNGFLDAKKMKMETHLYVNLQNKVKKRGGNEKGRCDALEALSNTYHSTFYLVTFSHDSPFYKQQAYFESVDDADKFKTLFINQLKSPESFFFSDNLKLSTLYDMLTKLLDHIHDTVFQSKEKLSIQDKQAFIDIAYALITLKLLEITGANTYNLSCKHAIDRGGKSSSLLFYIAGLLNNQQYEEDFMRRHMIVTHAPAILVKKRAMLKSRRDRLKQALAYLERSQESFVRLKPFYNVSTPF